MCCRPRCKAEACRSQEVTVYRWQPPIPRPPYGIHAIFPDCRWRKTVESNARNLLLDIHEAPDAVPCQTDQRGHLRVVEWRMLRRRLYLDEAARAGHDDVHIDAGLRI